MKGAKTAANAVSEIMMRPNRARRFSAMTRNAAPSPERKSRALLSARPPRKVSAFTVQPYSSWIRGSSHL